MKVLFTHPFFLPFVARGAEVEIRDAGVRLIEAGQDVELLTTRPKRITQRAHNEFLPTTYVHAPLSRAKAAQGWDEASIFHDVVAAQVHDVDADLIHCWHYADAAAAAARRPGVPMILKLTGTVLPERIKARRPLQAGLLMRALQTADEVWCNSEYARSAMAGFGVEMKVVPAGVAATPGASPRADVPTALVASSADDPRKRVEEIVDAWPAVIEAMPHAQLMIVGEASRQTRGLLRDRISPQVARSIFFVGVVQPNEMSQYYSNAWVSLSPGIHEALGLVTIEALAHGTRVIGARSGATADLLSGCGTLVEPGDIAGWSAAILSALAEDPADHAADAMIAAAPFEWEQIIPTYLESYTRLLGR